MSELSLVIGNKNASSWSLRPWLLMKEAGLKFDEIIVDLFSGERREKILHHSPAARVPILRHGDLMVWDSLAICEYIAELAPEGRFWPEDSRKRAHARSVSAEMHAGFPNVREQMPMACLQSYSTPPLEGELLWEVNRIRDIWQDCLDRYGGPYLFGGFTVADAMYAPVVSRFHSYRIHLEDKLRAWSDRMLQDTAMKEWYEECDPKDV